MVFGEPPWPKIGEEDLSVRVTNDLFVDFGNCQERENLLVTWNGAHISIIYGEGRVTSGKKSITTTWASLMVGLIDGSLLLLSSLEAAIWFSEPLLLLELLSICFLSTFISHWTSTMALSVSPLSQPTENDADAPLEPV